MTTLPAACRSLDDLAELTRHPRPDVRRWALERLARSAGDGAAEEVLAGLGDADAGVATTAARWIELPEPVAAGDAALARYRAARSPLAGALALALGTIQDERLIDVFGLREAAGLVDAEERRQAWYAMAGLDSDRVVPLLLRAWPETLASGEADTVATLAHALTLTEHEAAIEPVARELLREHPREIRDALLGTLLPLTLHPLNARELTRLASGEGGREARSMPRLLRSLESFLDPVAAADLGRAWAGNRTEACLRQIAAIGRDLPVSRSSPEPSSEARWLVTALARDPDAALRLRRIEQRQIVCLAVLALDSIRRLEASAATPLPDDPHERLRLALSSADPPLVDTAVRELMDTEPTDDMVVACCEALQDEDPEVRIAACSLLAAWEAEDAVTDLTELLGDEPDVAEAAIEALASLGEDALLAVAPILEDGVDPDRVGDAIAVCSHVPGRLATSLLAENFERLWAIEPETLLAAAEALGATTLAPLLEPELPGDDAEIARVHSLLVALDEAAPEPEDDAETPPGVGADDPDAATGEPPAVPRPGPPGVGRNAPCPCGSGRKFKKCCLGKDAGPAPGP